MAYMSTENAKRIRDEIKAAFPAKDGWKFSISKDHHLGINVNVMQAPIDFIKEYSNTFSDAHCREKNMQLNHHYLDRNFKGKALKALQQMMQIINKGNHDRSDSQTDYFDVGWYVHLEIGKWNQAFVYKPKAKKGKRPSTASAMEALTGVKENYSK